MIAVIMCGGQGTRMKSGREKPMLLVRGSPIIARALDALEESRKFGRIFAAVSPATPETRKYLDSRGTPIIETPGKGYPSDLSLVLNMLKPERVLVISADMPLVTPGIIGEITQAPQAKPLVSVVLTKKFVESVGVTPSVTFSKGGTDYCQSGISVFDTTRCANGAVEEQYLVMDRVELAVNVNTKEELLLAETLLIERAQDLSKDSGLAP